MKPSEIYAVPGSASLYQQPLDFHEDTSSSDSETLHGPTADLEQGNSSSDDESDIPENVNDGFPEPKIVQHDIPENEIDNVPDLLGDQVDNEEEHMDNNMAQEQEIDIPENAHEHRDTDISESGSDESDSNEEVPRDPVGGVMRRRPPRNCKRPPWMTSGEYDLGTDDSD